MEMSHAYFISTTNSDLKQKKIDKCLFKDDYHSLKEKLTGEFERESYFNGYVKAFEADRWILHQKDFSEGGVNYNELGYLKIDEAFLNKYNLKDCKEILLNREVLIFSHATQDNIFDKLPTAQSVADLNVLWNSEIDREKGSIGLVEELQSFIKSQYPYIKSIVIKDLNELEGQHYNWLYNKIDKVPIESSTYKVDNRPTFFIINNLAQDKVVNDIFEYSKATYYLDSSIWTIPIFCIEKEDDDNIKFNEDFIKNQIDQKIEITKRYELRYAMSSAVENREFNLRQWKNSWLIDGGAHTKKVEPFIFHSETKMKNLILGGLQEKESTNKGKFKYLSTLLRNNNKPILRICLCDDYADKSIRKFDYKKETHTSEELPTKLDIVKNNFEFLTGDLLQLSDENHFQLKFEESIKLDFQLSVENLLDSNKRYDLILLDYLFSLDEDGNEKAPSYGTEFFKSEKYNNFPHGFLKRHWILPISAFADSMINELQNEGVTFTSEDRFMSKGADPITEPYLFLYELLFVVNEQVKNAIDWCIDWDTKTVKKIKETLSRIETDNHQKLAESREQWIRQFSTVSDIFSIITTINHDSVDSIVKKGKSEEVIKDSKSYLARSIRNYLELDLNQKRVQVLTYYRDLLYQLAFKSYKDNEFIFMEGNKLRHALEKLNEL